jgi:serine/threonine protein kinase
VVLGTSRPKHYDCLTEDDALSYIRGDAVRSAGEVQDHLDVCSVCRVLVGEAASALAQSEAPEEERSPASRRRTLEAGHVILRRYEIVRFLARGGMGEVYEARDMVLGEVIALKTLVATALDDAKAMSRLRAEVKFARQVTHPNVCRILEFGVHQATGRSGEAGESIPFLTMEFLRGETLEQRLARVGRMPPAEVGTILEQMIAGLGAIHAAGIVHRDLKPANVFVLPGARERVVLMDFGLARAVDPRRWSGNVSGSGVAGTIDYMAPEQLEGKPLTPRFDIYALGLLVFEMLTGRKPFSGGTPLASAVERVTRPPPRPSDLVPALDPAYDEIVARCLAKDPAKRFPSVHEVAARLGAVGKRDRAPRRGRRIAWAAGLAGLVVLAAPVLVLRAPSPRAPASPVVRPTSQPATTASLDTAGTSAGPAPAPPAGAAESSASSAASTPSAGRRAGNIQSPRVPVPAHSGAAPERRTGPDDLLSPRLPRPRHPDDVINPFETNE